jgi:hypothetical protein
MRRIVLGTALICGAYSTNTWAQDERRVFAGALVGVSALSADARAIASPPEASVSLYDPGLGPALNAFAGLHVYEYLSVQGNYIWNRNQLTLVSTAVTALGGASYEQQRTSAQYAVVADALVYFRRRDSLIRPYLGTGLAFVYFTSQELGTMSAGLVAPAANLSSTFLALRSHVGIDVAISRRVSVRYSFSESIGGNPISPHLTPPGQRGLMNFQNLFGLLTRF